MKESAVDFLKKMIRIRSVNPPGNELLVAREIKKLLDDYGIENELIEFEEGRANVVAWLRGENRSEHRKVLGLSGHMDVVPPGEVEWDHDPFAAHEEDGKIYGRGTSDMKGGLVALLFAVTGLKEKRFSPDGDIKLLVTAGEEKGAVGAKQLVESGHMNEVTDLLIAEPTRNQIRIAEKGALWVEITCYGKTAHGSSPHLGVNAIEHMYHLIHALLNDFEMKYRPDELLGEPTFNIAVIEGGVKTNVVPDRCRIEVDFRTVPSQNHEEILKELNQLLENVQQRVPGLHADINVINNLPAVKTNPEDTFVSVIHEILEKENGSAEAPSGMTGYTDGAAFVGEGKEVPLVILGAGEERLAHQPNEYIEIQPFLDSIELYQKIIRDYLS